MEEKKDNYIVVFDSEMQELRDEYMMPFSCAVCGKMMENWDTSSFYKYGCCANCDVEFIADRTINSDLLNSRSKMKNYLKEKHKQKIEKLKKDLLIKEED